MNRSLLRAGFVLILLALLSGLAMPLYTNPRMGLSAHVGGVTNALLLIAVAIIWGRLTMSERFGRILYWTTVYTGYVNFSSSLLAAFWGTSRLTPLAGEGYAGAAWQEGVVFVLLNSIVVTALVSTIMVILALKPSSDPTG